MRRKQSKVVRPRQVTDGTIYLLKLWIDDLEVLKVGVTANTVGRRVLGIIESVWKSYGYFPRVEVLYECKTRNHYDVEAKIHSRLRGNGYGYQSLHEFSGSSELFLDIANDMVVSIISDIIEEDERVSFESIDRVSDIL